MNIKAVTVKLAPVCIALALGGCATVPEQKTWLDGTSWTIEDVNQTSTAGQDNFKVSFANGRFDASFGCRRATGKYTLRYTENGDPRPLFQGSDASITGTACTGLFAEQVGPEILSNGALSLSLLPDGRLTMLEPPTGIILRPR